MMSSENITSSPASEETLIPVAGVAIEDESKAFEARPPHRVAGMVRHALPLIRSWLAYATLPVAGLLTAPIAARMLGPEGRGQLAGILQPMTLAGAVAALGVPSAVTYFVGRRYESRQVHAHAAKISVAMTVTVAAVLLFYSGKVAQQIAFPRGILLLIWCAFLPSAFISIRRSYLQGERQYSKIDLERTLISALRVAGVVLLWLAGFKHAGSYAVAYMVGGLAASAVLWLPVRGSGLVSDQEVQKLQRWELLRFALFSSFGTIATAMNSRLDQAIMPAVVPAIELGYYSVAVTVAEVSTIITSVIARNVLAETSARVSKRHIRRNLLLGGVAQLVFCGVMLAAIPYVLPLVFGKDFAPAVNLVKILLFATVIGYGADCSSAFLAGSGAPEYASIGPAAGAITTAVLFWVFWHQMGAVAAAWISVATQAATFVTGTILIGLRAARSRNGKIPERA